MLRVTLISGSFGDGLCGVGDYTYALARQLSNYVQLTVIGPSSFLINNNAIQNQTTTSIDASALSFTLQPFNYDSDTVSINQIKQWIDQNPDYNQESESQSDGTFNYIPANSYSLWRLGNLTKLIKQTKPDIVHIQYPSKGYKRSLGIEFLPLRFDSMVETIKLVTTIHEFSNAHWLRKAAVYPMASLSHHIITSTPELARDLEYYRNSNVSIIPVGNNFELNFPVVHNPSVKITDILNEKPLKNSLFHFGFITKGKGIENLLYSLAILRLKIPTVKLYFACDLNNTNSYHRFIRKLIDTLGLNQWIEFIGEQPVNILKAIAPKFSYQVFPFDDGMSDRRSSAISALELECPIITTRGAQTYPLLSVQPKKPQLLADYLLELLDKESIDERNSLLYAQRMLKEAYSFNRIAKQHYELYQHIL